MNILILANHFNAGGISSYILNLAEGLIARGHRVYVGSSGGQWRLRLEKLNIKHLYLPLNTKSIISPRLIGAYFALKKIIEKEGIEIIHTQTRVSSVLAHWVSLKAGVPFLSTAHGFFRPRWVRLMFPCWGKFVIAISEAVKEHLIKDFGVSLDKIMLVHNGIDVTTSQVPGPTSHELKESYGLNAGPVVGIIARLSEVKGHKFLLAAMKKVLEEIPEAQLLSIGEGKIKKDLENLAKNLKLEKKVKFVPAVSDTAEALSIMDVFVMPSLQEGLGLSVMEAMRAGVPVVASAVGGIFSLVKDNETGILVKPKDSAALASAIIELLKNKTRAAQLSAQAKDLIVNEFSLEKMVQETEKVYQLCLSQQENRLRR